MERIQKDIELQNKRAAEFDENGPKKGAGGQQAASNPSDNEYGIKVPKGRRNPQIQVEPVKLVSTPLLHDPNTPVKSPFDTNVVRKYLNEQRESGVDQHQHQPKQPDFPVPAAQPKYDDPPLEYNIPVRQIAPDVSKQYLEQQRQAGETPRRPGLQTIKREIQGELQKQLAHLKQPESQISKQIEQKFQEGLGEIRQDLHRANQEMIKNLDHLKRETQEAVKARDMAIQELESLKLQKNNMQNQPAFQPNFHPAFGKAGDEIDVLIRRYGVKENTNESAIVGYPNGSEHRNYQEDRPRALDRDPQPDKPRRQFRNPSPQAINHEQNYQTAKPHRIQVQDNDEERWGKPSINGRYSSQPIKAVRRNFPMEQPRPEQLYGSINLEAQSNFVPMHYFENNGPGDMTLRGLAGLGASSANDQNKKSKSKLEQARLARNDVKQNDPWESEGKDSSRYFGGPLKKPSRPYTNHMSSASAGDDWTRPSEKNEGNFFNKTSSNAFGRAGLMMMGDGDSQMGETAGKMKMDNTVDNILDKYATNPKPVDRRPEGRGSGYRKYNDNNSEFLTKTLGESGVSDRKVKDPTLDQRPIKATVGPSYRQVSNTKFSLKSNNSGRQDKMRIGEDNSLSSSYGGGINTGNGPSERGSLDIENLITRNEDRLKFLEKYNDMETIHEGFEATTESVAYKFKNPRINSRENSRPNRQEHRGPEGDSLDFQDYEGMMRKYK